jgi:hypothetical protein
VADSPNLFEFVAGIKEGGGSWVFPFDAVQEICEVLRAQLAYLFLDALEVRAKVRGCGGLRPALQGLPASLIRLIVERPRFWEYLLFSEALEQELENLGDIKKDWQYGLVSGRGINMAPAEFIGWIQGKLSEVSVFAPNVERAIRQALPVAFGPPGVSGDPGAILHAANRLAAVYKAALEWKLDFRRIALPAEIERLRAITEKICDNIVSEVEEFSRVLKDSLTTAVSNAQDGRQATVQLCLTLTVPDQSELGPEMNRVVALIRSGALANS